MPSFLLTSGVNPGQTLGDSQTGYVGRDAIVNGLIIGSSDGIDLRIHGEVVNNGVAVIASGANNTIVVGATGIVESFSSSSTSIAAVEFATLGGQSRLFNAGQINGNAMAIFARASDGTDTALINNSGTMTGEEAGVFTDGNGLIRIENTGVISGFRHGISNSLTIFSSPFARVDILNRGTISGVDAAIVSGSAADRVGNGGGMIEGDVRLGGGNDTLDNRGGTIEGDVTLGDGNDLLDNRGGTIIGSIDGGLGNDTFLMGAGIETINGGIGTDVIDFRGTPAVEVSLDDSLSATGHAVGDEYISIETVFGSFFGDHIVGSTSVNNLRGYDGVDTIDGGAGNDVLSGGKGADVVTGGAGSDVFLFGALNEIGDTITDFSAGAGNDDVLQLRGSSLGGGLALGVLAATAFQSRADNVAQDATDRFIFRTTDRTVWFDVDGNGSRGPVLVADLQAGAVFDLFDIVII